MYHSIFKDQNLSKDFDRDGFVKVPFLDDEGVILFRSFIEKYLPVFQECKYQTCSTTDLSNPAIVDDVDVFVSSHIQPYVDKYLTNYQPILGNYLVKKPGPDSSIPIHQDWTFVDESKFYSLSIWCALQDTDQNNGNLQVIPKTHKMSPNLRSSPSFLSGFSSIMEKIRSDLMDIPLKAGEAILYNHALLHASPPNNSDKTRTALIFGATHAEAQLLHYYLPEDFYVQRKVRLKKFNIDKDFFLQHVRGKYPQGVDYVGEYAHNFESLSWNDYRRIVGMKSKESIIDKISDLFSWHNG